MRPVAFCLADGSPWPIARPSSESCLLSCENGSLQFLSRDRGIFCPVRDAVSDGKATHSRRKCRRVTGVALSVKHLGSRLVVLRVIAEDHGLDTNEDLQDGGHTRLPLLALSTTFPRSKERKTHCVKVRGLLSLAPIFAYLFHPNADSDWSCDDSL